MVPPEGERTDENCHNWGKERGQHDEVCVALLKRRAIGGCGTLLDGQYFGIDAVGSLGKRKGDSSMQALLSALLRYLTCAYRRKRCMGNHTYFVYLFGGFLSSDGRMAG